jgi:hypothetical protein
MNGALMKAASRFTIAAAFGLVLGVSSAQAADLGGNCCADLEERIADLEATTARKGNRKMSLTITGQVHRMVLWWDDGHRSDTYYGLDNTNSSSRFSFTGTAKVTPTVSFGFDITIEIEAGGTSSKVSQFDEDGKLGAQINGGFGASFNAANVDAYFGDARRVAWWVEDTRLGRLTVGRYESAGAITTIDLAGIGAGASASVILVNGGFLIRGPGSTYWATTIGALGDPAANQGRTELIRWDSPTYQGFILSASIGEAGDYWGVMLRYANEFNGVRIAAGIGYEDATDRFTANSCVSVPALNNTALTGAVNSCINPPGAGPANLVDNGEVRAWGAGLSLLHVPSGLFAQGHYMRAMYDDPTAPLTQTTTYWGQVLGHKDSTQWLIQAGISKNWFGIGNTALFAEYSKNDDWGAGIGNGRNFSAAAIPGAVSVNGVVDTDMNVWGAGITQLVDSAATELYLNWRHFTPEINCTGGRTAAGVCAGAAGTAASHALPTESFDAIIGGARVKF